MALRMREASQPEVAIARQRAENELTDIAADPPRAAGRAGPAHTGQARSGSPRRHGTGAARRARGRIRRRARKTSTPTSVADQNSPPKTSSSPTRTGRGWECERVGHLKIGFDVRSLGPADSQTGYRDPVEGIRRIEVKGRTRGHPIRLTTNEWYKAAQLGDSYWLYVVWDPLGIPDPLPLIIRNPVKHLDHAKREVIAARHYDIPAQAIEAAASASKDAK